MEQLDEQILDYLHENGMASPSILASERTIVVSEARIQDRCKRLTYAELIAPIAGSLYEITMDGTLYLRGELDASHKPRPTRLVLDDECFATSSRYARY